MAPQKKCEIVANPNFPNYAICAVSGRHVIVAGGGGAAKTGIKNQFDVYELYHNGQQTTAERVLSHDVGDACISNMAAWEEDLHEESSLQINSNIMLAIGSEEKCMLMRLVPRLVTRDNNCSEGIETLGNEIPDTNNGDVRNRKSSRKEAAEEKLSPSAKVTRKKSIDNNHTLRGDKYFSYDVENLLVTETVFRTNAEDDIYQKCCRLSPDQSSLATGGMDGHIRIWGLPLMNKLKDIKAHEKEVDDLDFKPDGKQIVSVSKPTRECCIWDVNTCSKVIQVAFQSNGIRYKCFRARYGIVEGRMDNTRLFTISNPVSGSKNPSIVAKWNGKTYAQERQRNLKGSLSSLSISDDGRYLATGTMCGTVYILIAFSLQPLKTVLEAHNMFVTGLEWVPTHLPEGRMVCGFSDASVLSISCDNTLRVHHIPRQEMLPVWLVAIVAALTLLASFFLATYLGL